MKKKLKLKKLPNGGQNPPIYTNDLKDPRLQAYQDSLNLYNQNPFEDKEIKLTKQDIKELNDARLKIMPYAKGEWHDEIPSRGYDEAIGQKMFFKKPVQPIVYSPPINPIEGGHRFDDGQTAWNGTFTEHRNKIEPILVQSQLGQLQANPQQLEFNPIPFKQGSYFTREPQSQEMGQKEYFDKKTGKKLMTYGGIYASGGGINRYDVPAQIPQNQQYFQLPFNEIATALAHKQKKQDDLVEKVNQNYSLLDSLRDGYDTQGLAQEVKSSYSNLLNNLENQELTPEKINNLKRVIQNDSRIGLLQRSAKEAELYDKYRQTHKDFNLWVQPQLDNQGNWIQAKDEQGNWASPKDYSGYINKLTPYNYWQSEVDDVGQNLKANVQKQWGANGTVFTGKDGILWVKTSDGKTIKALDENSPQYKAARRDLVNSYSTGTTGGAQYLKALTASHGLPWNEETISNFIDPRLKSFTYREEEEKQNIDLAPEYLQSGVEEDAMLIPYDETTSEEFKPVFNNLDFLNKRKAGEAEINSSAGNMGMGVNAPGLGTYKINKTDKDSYKTFSLNDYNPSQKVIINNAIIGLEKTGLIPKEISAKLKSGKELTFEEKDKFYPALQKSLERFTKAERMNSGVEGFSDPKDADGVTAAYFGKKEPKVKDLGTGLIGNKNIYDVKNNEFVDYKTLKKRLVDGGYEEEPIKITGKLTGDNVYEAKSGHKGELTDGYQFFAGGNMYLIGSPKVWKGGKAAGKLNEQKQINTTINNAKNAYIYGAYSLGNNLEARYNEGPNGEPLYTVYKDNIPLTEIKDDQGNIVIPNTFTSPQELAVVIEAMKEYNIIK